MLFPAMAGGLGWGIRGQYGHETGAMIAGLLVCLTLVLLFCPRWPSLSAARAVALGAIAIGFGGSMTYGQTVGLTHDAPLVGNWAALGWGLLGLAIKGGIWIGFAGAFLGMGLGGVRYRPLEMLGVFAGMIVLLFVGVWLLNEPFDPAQKILPRIYFSDDWRWEPDAVLKPRREKWGGLLFALIGLVVYLGWIRRDRLARNLAGWAALGGAMGFPLGQCLQAFHAWNLDLFRSGVLAKIAPVINWWNMMETTFGAAFGAILGLGLWLNRRRVIPAPAGELPSAGANAVETALLIVYVPLLLCWEFFSVPVLDAVAEPGVPMGVIPVMAIVMGRWWPYWVTLPLTLIPIAGKTLLQLCYKEQIIGSPSGWLLYVILPLLVATAASVWCIRRASLTSAGAGFLRLALLLNVWLYFGLNYAFFHFPWPWSTWTARTPNSLIYLACAIGLSWLVAADAWRPARRRQSRGRSEE